MDHGGKAGSKRYGPKFGRKVDCDTKDPDPGHTCCMHSSVARCFWFALTLLGRKHTKSACFISAIGPSPTLFQVHLPKPCTCRASYTQDDISGIANLLLDPFLCLESPLGTSTSDSKSDQEDMQTRDRRDNVFTPPENSRNSSL